MKRLAAYILLFLVFIPLAFGKPRGWQTANQGSTTSKDTILELQRSMPSEREFSELLSKADEKISVFEAAVKNAKASLDKINPKYSANYLDAAATAHLLISKAIKNGFTAYSLVGILTTLDDLSLDAATGVSFLLAAGQGRTTSEILALSGAGTSCNDIAELLFHATMRLIAAEETALGKLLDDQH